MSEGINSRPKRPSKAKPATGEPPKKKRRPSLEEESDATDGSEDPNAKILLMEQGILESKKNYNDIVVLLGTMGDYESGNPESMLATVALSRVFMRLLGQGALVPKRTLSDKQLAVVNWLREQFKSFKTLLLSLLDDEELGVTALTLCMRVLQAEGQVEKDEYSFPTEFLRQIVHTVLQSEDEDVAKAYTEEYLEQFDDIRYHTFSSITTILQEVGEEDKTGMFDAVLPILSALDGVPESAEELEDWYIARPKKKTHNIRSVQQHKRRGQEAWLALMSIVETKEQRKRLLKLVSTIIAPWFTKPELLADFLTNSYDAGGSMSLLALSGVFYLIQERNLDYPLFYHKLYSLLDNEILHSKHRAPFFRLLNTFLSSTHLPAALVASFIKRLCRLSLNAPPSAIVFVIPWIYNQMREHPTCTAMLHREIRDPDVKKDLRKNGMDDPFDPNETDPMQTDAIESSLWEVTQLQSHYHPNVSTIAKILSEQFTKQSYNIEDFLDHSYATLLDAELSKELRKAPAVEFHIPKRVFLPQDEPAVNPDTLVAKLWDFS